MKWLNQLRRHWMFRLIQRAGGGPRNRSKRGGSTGWVRFLALLAGVACGAVIGGATWAAMVRYVSTSNYFQIGQIEVRGDLTPESIRTLASVPVSPGSPIFDIDLVQLGDRLTQAHPEFRDMTVIRKLPNTVVIEVETRVPQARLAYGGQLLCVDEHGMIFPNVSHPRSRDLPLIGGLEPSAVPLRVGEVTKAVHVKGALALWEALGSSGLLHRFHLAQINAADYKDLAVQFVGWPEIHVGHEAFAERLKRFEQLVPAIEGRKGDIQYIDVRFPEPIIKPK